MATETKVGLLAGLAFIICFAVILANRGQTRRYAADMGLERTPRQRVAPPRDSVDRFPNAGRTGRRPGTDLTVSPALTTSVETRFALRQPARSPLRVDTPVPTVSGAEIEWTSGGGSANPRASLADPVPDRAFPPRAFDSSRHSALTASNANPEKETAALADLLRRRAEYGVTTRSERGTPTRGAGPAAANTIAPIPSTPYGRTVQENGVPAAAQHTRMYRVVSGDTLTSIARRYYGAASRRHLDVILDANRSVLANPDVLKVGMLLALPGVDRETMQRVSSPVNARGARLVAGRGRVGLDARWYQVQKNDRYVSIARKQLGDASRWRELFDLNKDKFPHPDQIREGVRIKLPPR